MSTSVKLLVSPTGDRAYRLFYRNNSELSYAKNEEISVHLWEYVGYIPLVGNCRYLAVYELTNEVWKALKGREDLDDIFVCEEINAETLERIQRKQPGVYTSKPMTYDERQQFNRAMMNDQVTFSVRNSTIQDALNLGIPGFDTTRRK